ncbi:Gfo/Idh/MocA family oxidoreductase [Georgenia sp. H159]|uniref:Gfo/Idh/MocA family protein n=1 Tax=Georgenia sp. H159 TaxID=3076115 RepID=UPI002D77D23F|nr:Gfo/Idh/MocA family oxidoreductase [Georgenia sp. H159]
MTEQTGRRRYAVAGVGHRAQMYIDAALGDHAEVAQLVAWCEPNPGRAGYYDEHVVGAGGQPLPRYEPADLETMIAEQRVDVVVVTSPDHTHADLVSRALRAGADAVVEKPLTIDAAGCRTIDDAVRDTGRDVIMTFNYRYSPRNSTLREVIADGRIGEVTSVHFEWALDTVHGADYFRRWHREKDKSGGLLVHKSSHHFDLVNWWLADAPRRVFALGSRRFYGDDGAGAATAAQPRPARGTDAPAGDPWALDLTADERLKRLYLDSEEHDGYLRDRDVFDPGITAEDTMAVLVEYERGAYLTYSLNAHAPWEGYRVTVNGTRGRAELEVVERGSVELDAQGSAVLDPSARDAADVDELRPKGERLLVQQHWERAREVPIPMGVGSHGGGDAILLADVFRGPQPDPLGRPAGYPDGVRAVAVGIAANESIRTGSPVDVADLGLGGVERR